MASIIGIFKQKTGNFEKLNNIGFEVCIVTFIQELVKN